MRKRILWIQTGGTFSCEGTKSGLAPQSSEEQAGKILAIMPQVCEKYDIVPMTLMNIDSSDMTISDQKRIADTIDDNIGKYDGIVITHGTDTMAYTAAALSYLIQNSPKPIVITGAQKPIDMENTDARTNLADSLRFASHDKAHGINIVFDGKVIAGTRGKKERTKSYNAFSSINFPYIAIIQEDHILFYLDDKAQVTEPLTFYHQMDSSVGLIS